MHAKFHGLDKQTTTCRATDLVLKGPVSQCWVGPLASGAFNQTERRSELTPEYLAGTWGTFAEPRVGRLIGHKRNFFLTTQSLAPRRPYIFLRSHAASVLRTDHMTHRVPIVHLKIARRLAPIAIVAIFGVAAAACGSSGGASTGGQPNTTTPTTTAGHSGGGSSGSGGAGF